MESAGRSLTDMYLALASHPEWYFAINLTLLRLFLDVQGKKMKISPLLLRCLGLSAEIPLVSPVWPFEILYGSVFCFP